MYIRDLLLPLLKKTAEKTINWAKDRTFAKFIAMFTLSCFLFSFVFADFLRATAIMTGPAIKVNDILSEFSLPSEMGKITGGKYLGSDKVVINIQDLHCNSEVQRKISDILGLLDKRFGLDSVLIEGASGELDTSWVDVIKDQSLKKQTIQTLLEKGMLSGSEYYSMLKGKQHLLRGIENPNIHKENLVRLGKIIEKQSYFEDKLAELKKDLAFLQSKYYGEKNRKFERILNKQSRPGSSEKYYRLLQKYVEKINKNPKEHKGTFAIHWLDYPNIKLYLELTGLSKKLDYAKISREMQFLIRDLKQVLPYSSYSKLIENTNNFSNLDQLYSLLPTLSKTALTDFGSRYQDLARFFEYIKKAKSLNPVEMITEEKRLIGQIRLGLSEDIAEFNISFLTEFLNYFQDYLTNKLSAPDYIYFSKRFSDFKRIWGSYTYENRLKELEPDFQLLDDFYRVNCQRNDCFVNNILKNMPGPIAANPPSNDNYAFQDSIQKSISSLKSGKIIVVISGGFHTEGIQNLLGRQGISCLTITPSITKDSKASDLMYRELARLQSKYLSNAIQLLRMSEKNARAIFQGDKVILTAFGGTFILEKGKTGLTKIEGPADNLKANSEIDSWIKMVNISAQLLKGITKIKAKDLLLFIFKNLSEYHFLNESGPIPEIANDANIQSLVVGYSGMNINEFGNLPDFLQYAILAEAKLNQATSISSVVELINDQPSEIAISYGALQKSDGTLDSMMLRRIKDLLLSGIKVCIVAENARQEAVQTMRELSKFAIFSEETNQNVLDNISIISKNEFASYIPLWILVNMSAVSNNDSRTKQFVPLEKNREIKADDIRTQEGFMIWLFQSRQHKIKKFSYENAQILMKHGISLSQYNKYQNYNPEALKERLKADYAQNLAKVSHYPLRDPSYSSYWREHN